MQDDFFEVSASAVLMQGVTHPPRCDHAFIVYWNGGCIHVNTYFRLTKKDVYTCCKYYDRKLCNTIEEYHALTADAIESQAYGSYMDGAR